MGAVVVTVKLVAAVRAETYHNVAVVLQVTPNRVPRLASN